MTTGIEGKRILIIEDEMLIAANAEAMISDMGATTVATVGTVAEALNLVRPGAADAALLDLNLGGQRTDSVATALTQAGIPFVVTTGYGAKSWAGDPNFVLDKPYSAPQLKAHLARALASEPHKS